MKKLVAVTLFALALTQVAIAEIADSSVTGFTFKTTLIVQAAPETVYKQFLAIGNWWDPSHTYSGDAHNLSIEQKAMGCFCESLPNGGAVRHMEVLLLMPGKMIVLSGGLGPLQSLAATGTMKIILSPAAGGTKVDVTYAVGGYLPAGMNTFASPVNEVLTEQFARFKNYVESGSPMPKKQP
ncbi:MAG TPA: hypothetical protein VE994_11400 [Terriglobales bacterium]|nr:hypothetical protein [Terriglobales bacterium]